MRHRGFGRTLFGGSRFLFWSLAPFLIGFALVMALMVQDWTSRRGILVSVLVAAAVLLLLALYDHVRFRWAGRVVAGLVFLTYASYLAHELATEGLPRRLPRSRAETTAFNALVGLLVIGVPALLYAVRGRFGSRKEDADQRELTDRQHAVCDRFGATCAPCDPSEKVGISNTALQGELPLNGLRHPPDGGTCGWYIWGGTELRDTPDFFKPIHVRHLAELRPEVLPYLSLPPGWRFLIAPDYEDVWFDESLL